MLCSTALRARRSFLAAVLFGLIPSAGFGQEQAPAPAPAPAEPSGKQLSDTGIEVIVVTSERREQDLQDVAQTVSAFSLEDLQEGNIQDAYDLQLKVPALVATGGLPAITLRGLGQDSDVLGPGIDPGFQLHINDIYVAQLAVALLAFNDLERVEVLPGPQGTLYGRNSTGGSMNLHTRKPQFDEYEFSGDFDWGRYDNLRMRMVGNIPLIEGKMAARIAYAREWPSNVYHNQSENGLDQKLSNNALSGGHNVRASIRFAPTDTITTDWIFGYGVDDDNGGRSRNVDPYPAFQAGQSTIFFGQIDPTGASPFSDELREYQANRRQTQHYETYWGQAIAEIQVPKHTVKLNGNYQYWDYAVDFDYDNLDVDAERLGLVDKHHTWSAEATITSDYEGPFSWLAGANYQTDDAPNTEVPVWNYQATDDLANYAMFNAFTLSAFNTPGSLGDPESVCGGPCIFQPGDLNHPYIKFDSDVHTETLGVFADGGYDITEQIRFQAGVRYSRTSRNMKDTGYIDVVSEPYDIVTDGFCPNVLGVSTFFGFDMTPKENCFEIFVAPFILQPQTTPFNPTTLDASNVAFLIPLKGNWAASSLNTARVEKDETWDSVTGRARIEFRPSDGQLFYAGYSRGERHGGFNFFVDESFDSETINAYEIGAKNTLFNDRLLLNTTAFFYDFRNRFINETVNNVVTTVNAPKAQIYGAELQWIWAPTDQLQITGNVGWLHAEITGDFFSQDNSVSASNPTSYCASKVYPNTPGSVFAGLPAVGDRHGSGPTCDGGNLQNLNGNVLPRAPEWSFTTSAEYHFEFSKGTVTPRVDFSYRGSVYYRQFENSLDEQEAYTRTDARIRFDHASVPVWVEIYGQNLEDRHNVKTQVDARLARPRSYWLAAPLTFGARIGWKFTGDSLNDALPF